MQAAYPEEAREQGLESKVVLRLWIDDQGRVTDAEVDSPVGHGFDEAAREAALRFRFVPAVKGGKPVPSVILYEYRFTLTPVRKASPSRPSEPARASGAIAPARVMVRLATHGVPVVGATVTLRGSDGGERVLVTDGNGEVAFPEVAPGRYRVTALAAGYGSVEADESFDPKTDTRLRYDLTPLDDSIEIRVQGEAQHDVTVRRVSREELTLVPGGSGDPIRVVESLPGVTTTSDGSLVIRGASPLLSGVMLDGMAIPFLYHNYEITSVVPADVVDSVTLYPGNFGVRYGRYIGGIVDVGLSAPDTRCKLDDGRPSGRSGCYHGLLQLDLIEGRSMVQGPIPGTRRWSFSVSARRSWLDYLMKEVAERADLHLQTAPRYYDGYAMVDYQGPGEHLSVRGIASNDKLAALIEERSASDLNEVGRFEFEYGFDRVQAVYEKQVTSALSLSSMLGLGRNYITLISDDYRILERSHPVAFRHELRGKLTPFLELNGGVDALVSPYSLELRYPPEQALIPPEERDKVRGTDATFGVFGEVMLRPVERVELLTGIRLDHSPVFSDTTFSPRLLARYRLVERPESFWLPRTTLKAGAGLYHQAPPILVRYFNDRLTQASMQARQYSLGLEQSLNPNLDFSAEGFFIDRRRGFSLDPDEQGGAEIGNQAKGSSIGLETFLRYHSDARFFGWIAYTLSHSVARNSSGELEHPSDDDRRHNLILVGSLDLGRGWRAGARFRYVSGKPLTDIIGSPRAPSLFDGQSGESVAQYTGENGARLPAFHQLDLRVDKRFNFRHWALTAYLDVRNVYNEQVVNYYEYNWDYSRRAAVQGLPVLPNLGVRGEI